MEFLPIRYGGERVYAGFWKRFCAIFFDAFILLPISFSLFWLEGFDKTLAIFVVIPSAALRAMYDVFFNACYGGSPGKLAVGIRVTKPNGSKIGWREAVARSSVDLIFALVILYFHVWALTQIGEAEYSNVSGIFEQGRLIQSHRPSWASKVDILVRVWVWSELIVLLLNERRRALHDFIAGTIVIRKKFADIPVKPCSSDTTSDADWVNASRGYVRGESDH